MSGPYGIAARGYLCAGYSPLPIPARRKKHPPPGWTGYVGAWPSGADVQAWIEENPHRNVGLRLPSGVLGIDVDAYGTKQGARGFSEAVERLGALPNTWRSTSRPEDTVSGIRLFRVPEGRAWADRLDANVEIVHHGNRYVMAAPSNHPEGRVYQWFDPDGQPGKAPGVDELPELPKAWVDELDRGPAAERLKAGVDDQQVVAFLQALRPAPQCQRVRDLLADAEAALSGAQSRHDVARNAVMTMLAAGDKGHHGVAEALHILWAAFDVACAQGDPRTHDPGEWGRMVSGGVAAVLADPTPEDDKGCCPIDMGPSGVPLGPPDDASLWGERERLQTVHDWARARMVAPWAVLGSVLARLCAAVPPFVTLPPIIGGEASLNLFVAHVGPSGSGKGACDRTAEAAINVHTGMPFTTIGAGSGEGLGHLYMGRDHKTNELNQHTQAVLLTVTEVDTLVGLNGRQGSTLMPELRKAWSGETLGFGYADPKKRLPVPAHHYRLAMTFGVQPLRAHVLLDDAAGGTPQRLLWFATTDPTMPDHPPPEPDRIDWSMPTKWGYSTGGTVPLTVCDQAVATIREAHVQRSRAQADALDGHALLCRLKVAALLAILDGRRDVADDDWRIAGLIQDHSDRTRSQVQATLAKEQRRINEQRARTRGKADAISEEAADDERVKQACRTIERRLARDGGEPVSASMVRKALDSSVRRHFDSAVDRLVGAGRIAVEEYEYHGQPATRMRRTGTAR